MLYDQIVVGDNIRRQRIKKGLSVGELADILEVSNSFIGLVERGQRMLGMEKLVRLLNAFGIKFEELLADMPDEIILQEDRLGYRVSPKKEKVDTIISLLSNLKENELNYIVHLIKCFKQYVRKSRELRGQ